MNRARSLAIATMLMWALTTVAPQTGTAPASSSEAQAQSGSTALHVPTVEEQLKLFTTRLDLTNDQQAKVKPILQELRDASLKLAQDQSLSREERLQNARPWRQKADRKIRAILSDDQKAKLDQVEHEPHPEMHGDIR